jgi:hypothetical protein
MKSSTSLPRKRINRAITALIVCMTACAPTLSLAAASATVNFGFSGGTSPVVPIQPGTTISTAPPLFKSIQASTELGTVQSATSSTTAVAQPTETAPGAAPQQSVKSSPKIGIGIDTLSSDKLKIYTIPLSYTINHKFSVQANLPIVTATIDDITGTSSNNTGIGDVNFTLKHFMGDEDEAAAFFTLLTTKFASGDANKGLGTGTYDIALTEKVIKRFGAFRGSLMAGIIQPLNTPTILGSQVEYGTTLSYMASVEHTVILPNLWLGVRTEGFHSFETKIDRIAQGNALTTLDVAPQLRYFFKRQGSVSLGVNIPVYTSYALAGGSNTRDVSVSFGISMMF